MEEDHPQYKSTGGKLGGFEMQILIVQFISHNQCGLKKQVLTPQKWYAWKGSLFWNSSLCLSRNCISHLCAHFIPYTHKGLRVYKGLHKVIP